MNVPHITPRGPSRRDVLAGFAGLAVAGAAAADEPDGRSFSFVALGDTHFDRLTHHDLTWLEREHPRDVPQVRNYTRHSAELLPALLGAVRQRLRDSDPKAALVVHVGDLVEGLCGSPELARKQCAEAVEVLRQAELGVPFLLTKGNHDVTGPGAADAYRQVLLPFLGRQVGQDLAAARYAYEHRGCLFVLYDGYDKASLPWLRQVLKARSARHVFVVVHQPVVPFQARANWSLLIHPRQQEERAQLLQLLGEHRAVVLVGHVHRYGVVARRTERGKFVQVALSSILSARDQQPRQVLDGLPSYAPDLVDLEPSFQPETRDERRQIFERERPAVGHFEYAQTAGYAVFTVRDAGVGVAIYNGAGERPWKTLNLTALLA